jgi:hypothetical protein
MFVSVRERMASTSVGCDADGSPATVTVRIVSSMFIDKFFLDAADDKPDAKSAGTMCMHGTRLPREFSDQTAAEIGR